MVWALRQTNENWLLVFGFRVIALRAEGLATHCVVYRRFSHGFLNIFSKCSQYVSAESAHDFTLSVCSQALQAVATNIMSSLLEQGFNPREAEYNNWKDNRSKPKKQINRDLLHYNKSP